jgi:hypothetical protein
MTNKSRDRMRHLIRHARLSIRHRGSVPAIVTEIARNASAVIREDDELFTIVLNTALNKLVRDELKRFSENPAHGQGLRAGQLEMFPRDARTTVEQIGRSEVFVPSRNGFVPLNPGELSPQEMDEAGEYLIHHGSDCIRRGGLLRRLSRIMQANKRAA